MTITQRRDHHEQTHRAAWIDWLHGKEEEMRQHSPEDYARFTAKRERERAELAADPKPWSRRVLDHFDTDTARLYAFREFFGLPDFWQWDADINSQSFQTNV